MLCANAWRWRCPNFLWCHLTGLDFSWRSHAIAAWWDMLVSNTFGNYRKLLEDVTLNPAMGYYLNTRGNRKENTARGRVPDENYGREVMQLFSLGLYQLNLDGTEKRDASGNKLESYTQSDITNIARIFTGWDFDQTQNVNYHRAREQSQHSEHGLHAHSDASDCGQSLHFGSELSRNNGACRYRWQWRRSNSAGHPVQPPQRGAVLWQTDDPAPGHQQPESGLCGARGQCLQQQRLWCPW
jgi:hypothetical protein